MGANHKYKKILGRLVAFSATLALAVWSEQSPRVLLYAHGISVLFRMIAVWLFARAAVETGGRGRLGELFTRAPRHWERSAPYRDRRTRKLAGISSYIVSVLTLLFMTGVVLRMGSGPGFLARQVLVPEASWAILIALIYLVDDLFCRRLVVVADEPVSISLGYNVGGLNFLVAAVFISAFLLVIAMNIAVWILGGGVNGPGVKVEWLILIVLTAVRSVYESVNDGKDERGGLGRI